MGGGIKWPLGEFVAFESSERISIEHPSNPTLPPQKKSQWSLEWDLN